MISAYTGQFADTATQIDNGIKLYMKQKGDTVAGKKIEIIRKDTGGPNPDVAKRLAQELVTRDNVDILAGFTLTPEALGASGVSAKAKKFMVIMNAATSVIITKSPYIVRTSVTLPQIADDARHLGRHEGRRHARPTPWWPTSAPASTPRPGSRRPSRRRAARSWARCAWRSPTPTSRPTCRRAKDLNPESIFVFIPGGAQPAALGKAFAERGIDPTKIKVLSTGEPVDETAIKALGDLALGRISAWHYDSQPARQAEQGLREGLQRRASSATPTSSPSAATTACT